MRFMLLFILLASSVSAQSQDVAYPLTATVVSSRISNLGAPGGDYLEVQALIDGHHLILRSDNLTGYDVLKLGDYKAKLVSDKHKKPYLTQQVYEIQYPDGATEKFLVIGESK
jgi:hypothetical protein